MKHLLSKSKTFAVLALSLLTGIGVLTGISVENTGTEKAEALSSGQKLYMSCPSSWFDAGAYVVACYNCSSGWKETDAFSKDNTITTKGGETLYYVSLTNTPNDFQLKRYSNSQKSSEWNRSKYISSVTSNLFRLQNGPSWEQDGSFASASVVQITIDTTTHGTIDFYQKDTSIGGSGYYYTDWDLYMKANPANGYDFDYWTANNTKWTSDATTNPVYFRCSDDGVTYGAKFKAKNYTLTFNPNGGSVTPTSKSVTMDAAYGDLPTPTKTGYKFDGWYTEQTGGVHITSDVVFTKAANETLYAHWTGNTYNVTYANGGHGTAPAATTATYGSNFTVASAITGVTGYTFSGWKDELGTSYTAGSTITWSKDSNTTLTAQWTANKYTVTLDPNGGSVTPTSIQVTYDGKYSNLPTPTYGGHNFDGWYTSGGTKIETTDTVKITENTTFTAHWSTAAVTVNVTYANGGHGTAPAATTATTGQPFTLAPAITGVTGYTFSKWKYGQDEYNAGETIASWKYGSDVIFTATWTNDTYNITYQNMTGAAHESGYPTTHTYGTDTTLKGATKTGYHFAGWFDNADFTGSPIATLGATTYTSDITLYAKWENQFVATITHLDETTSTFELVYDSTDGHYKNTNVQLFQGDTITVTNRNVVTPNPVDIGIDKGSQGIWQNEVKTLIVFNETTTRTFNMDMYLGKDEQTQLDRYYFIATYKTTPTEADYYTFIGETCYALAKQTPSKEQQDLGYDVEYVATVGGLNNPNILVGNTVTFKNNLSQTDLSVNREKNSNEYLDNGTHRIKISATGSQTLTVYLKHNKNNDQWYSYVTGLFDNVSGYSLIIDDTTNHTARVVPLVEGKDGSGNTQYEAYSISINPGEMIHIYHGFDDDGDVYFQKVQYSGDVPNAFTNYDNGHGGGAGTATNGATESHSFNFFFKAEIDYNQMYIADGTADPSVEAKAFAQSFNSAISCECSLKQSGDSHQLKITWEYLGDNTKPKPATRQGVTITITWNELSSAAQAILTAANETDTDPDIAAFAAKYDYVYMINATTYDLTDFANRNPVKLQQNANRTWKISDSEDQTILIVVIASASLLTLSAGALTILLKKKKKHTND